MGNIIVIVGRISSEVKLKDTEKGGKKASFSLSDSEGDNDTFFGVSKLVNSETVPFQKGDLVQVSGSLLTRKDGQGISMVVSANRVVPLESKLTKYIRNNQAIKLIAEGEMYGVKANF